MGNLLVMILFAIIVVIVCGVSVTLVWRNLKTVQDLFDIEVELLEAELQKEIDSIEATELAQTEAGKVLLELRLNEWQEELSKIIIEKTRQQFLKQMEEKQKWTSHWDAQGESIDLLSKKDT